MTYFGPQKDEKLNGYSLTLSEGIAWAFRRRKHFKIKGHSMVPLIQPYQHILVRTKKLYKLGDVVVVGGEGKFLIKKIVQLRGPRIYLEGINKDESIELWLPYDSIVGKLTAIF
ncbi:MAG: phage repressor protein C with HTH and peptisase S24 domain [Oceanicoccus sp.]|jgi:phage repressor protein C with HTH and peptisase S24 domain